MVERDIGVGRRYFCLVVLAQLLVTRHVLDARTGKIRGKDFTPSDVVAMGDHV